MAFNKEEIMQIAFDLFEKGNSRENLCQRLALLNLMLSQVFPEKNFLSKEKIDIMALPADEKYGIEINRIDDDTIKFFSDSIAQSSLNIQELHWLIAERKYVLKKLLRNM